LMTTSCWPNGSSTTIPSFSSANPTMPGAPIRRELTGSWNISSRRRSEGVLSAVQ
jgi:hypothetical protein